MTDYAKLGVEIALRNGEYLAGLAKMHEQTNKFAKDTQSSFASLKGFLVGGAITGVFAQIVKESTEAQQAQAQLAATLKSTGSAAGMSASELTNLSKKLSDLTSIDDDVVLGAENILLTFTNIKSNVFPETTKAVLDLSVAMKQDFQSSAVQVGKALNDPLNGLKALQRVGVAFSADQKKMIEQFVRFGDVASAQKVILAELNREFGGSAAAASKTLGGSMNYLKNSVGDLMKEVGGNMAPGFAALGEALKKSTAEGSAMVQVAQLLGANLSNVLRITAAITGSSSGGGAISAIVDSSPLVLMLKYSLLLVTQIEETYKRIESRRAGMGTGAFGLALKQGVKEGTTVIAPSAYTAAPTKEGKGDGGLAKYLSKGDPDAQLKADELKFEELKALYSNNYAILEQLTKTHEKIMADITNKRISQGFAVASGYLNQINSILSGVNQIYAQHAQQEQQRLDQQKKGWGAYFDFMEQRELQAANVQEKTRQQQNAKTVNELTNSLAKAESIQKKRDISAQLSESKKEEKRLAIQQKYAEERQKMELLYELYRRQLAIREFQRNKAFQYANIVIAAQIGGMQAWSSAMSLPVPANYIAGAIGVALTNTLMGISLGLLHAQQAPAFEEGSWYVPKTGPAVVHEGELIANRSMADSIRSGDAVLGKSEGVNIHIYGPIYDKVGFLKVIKSTLQSANIRLAGQGAY